MNPEQSQNPIFIIEGLRQQIYMMGANDSENSQIDAILQMYKKEKSHQKKHYKSIRNFRQ